MLRGPTPRRRRRDGEVWHKNKGPHRTHETFLLCFRCRRAISVNGWRRHARICFGIRKCFACESPFPCRNGLCTWSKAIVDACAVIPRRLVPYFRWLTPRQPRRMTDEQLALEKPALRWLKSLERSP